MIVSIIYIICSVPFLYICCDDDFCQINRHWFRFIRKYAEAVGISRRQVGLDQLLSWQSQLAVTSPTTSINPLRANHDYDHFYSILITLYYRYQLTVIVSGIFVLFVNIATVQINSSGWNLIWRSKHTPSWKLSSVCMIIGLLISHRWVTISSHVT